MGDKAYTIVDRFQNERSEESIPYRKYRNSISPESWIDCGRQSAEIFGYIHFINPINAHIIATM
jgi:hypothetical protein